MTTLPLQSWRNFLYIRQAQSLHQLSQFNQVHGAEWRTPRCQVHQRVFRNEIRPTRRNRHQMLAFLVEVDSVLAPGMQVGDKFELLTGPRVKPVSDSETSAQTVRISRS
jgi:hypothetical protein